MAARKSELIITCNAKGVENVMRILDERLKGIKQQLQTLNNYGSKHGWTDDMKKDFKELTEEAAGIDTIMKRNQQTMRKYGEVMKDLAGAKLKDLKKALQEGKAALNNMSARDPNREKLVHDLQRIQKQIETNTGALKSHGSAWQSAVKNITAYVGVFGMFNFVKNKISEVIRGGEELSDQMAQVRMVSGLAMEDIEDLTRTLAKMDTRTTLSELERIAYAGAKLGFGEYGTKGLEEFVRAANQVNVALREDLGEEALTALSKITENMGLIKKMGVEDAMLATSSAMFKLAATSTAAAGPIVEVTKRLVPVAQASGMATHEILALASASDSLQLMPEVVGTALSKLLMAMQNNHNLIEQTLGIDEGTIARMIKAGDVMDAMLMIFDKMSGKNMTELSGIWKLLGSDGQRLITVVQAMANHTDTLRKHLETSTQAFKEATAVTEEYNIQQETAAALMQRASNLWRNAMVNADTSLSVKEMAKSWYDFSKSVLDSEFSLGAIKLTIDALLGSIRLLINLLPMIAFGLMAKGAAMLAVKLSTAKMAVDGFTLSWKKMDAATKANWISLAIGFFAQLAFSIAQWAKSSEEAEASQRKLNQALDSAAEKAEQEIAAMSRLKAQVEDTSLSQEERMKMFSKFKTDYDIYLNYLGIELKSVDELAKHYDALTKVMRQRFAYQEREDYKRDVMGGEDGLRMRRRTAGSDLTRIANDTNQKVDLSVIDSYVASGVKPGEISQKILGKRPNVQMSIPTDKLRDAIVHYAQARLDETLKEKQIDAAFAQEIGDFDYDKWLRTQVNGDFKLKPDKAAIAAAKKEAQDRKKALKLEMDEAQKASTGIISKLEEYYRLQEAAINDARADGQLTEEQAKEMVRALSIVKNESLATARRAVTTGETKDWDELKIKVLPAVMSDTSEVSRNLLETIQQVSVQKLHDDLKKFNGDQKTVLGLDSRAFFDQMNAKAAGNTREAARLKAKLFNDAEKMVKQYRIFDQAVDRMRDDVEQMGFITETYEQFAERMRKGIEKKPVNVLSLTKQQQQARQQMTDRFNTTQGVGSSTPDDMGKWFKEFTDNGKEEWMRALPELQKWVLDTDKYKDEINNLYELLKKVQRGESIQMTSAQMAPTNAQIDQAVGTRITDQEVNAAMGFKFLGQGTIPYRINIENADEALQWMRQFGMTASGELEVWAQAIPRLREMLEPMQRQDELLKRQAELKEKGKDLTTEELEELKKIPDTLAEAIPQIQALYYKMDEFANKIPESIKKQVEMMTSRNPIGIDEIRQQGQQRVAMTEQFYDEKIAEANNSNSPEAAAELERQKQQDIFDIKEEYRQKEYQIQEQMGVTWQQQYENELAMYQNMLNKKLISEEQFQKKRGQLQAQLGLKYGQYYNGLMSNLVDTLQNYEITSVEAEYDAKIAAARENGQDTAALEEEKERKIMETRKKYAALQLAVKISEIIMNTAAGIMMAYATLPTPAAIAATALISATGAAQLALAKAEYDKVMAMSVSSSKSSSTSSATKTKLVSGMLTYDKGNVSSYAASSSQQNRRKLYDNGGVSSYAAPSSQQKHRYLGTDGRVYTATEEPAPQDGLITHPIATTVQGQPALVAENGPEIVIGRETTKAIMMNEPELIRYLANYQHERTRRLYDSGTMPAAPASAGSAAVPAGSPAGSNSAAVPSGSAPVPSGSAPVPDGSPSGEDATAERQALISRLDRSDELMSQVLYFLQNPVAPEIAMYDTSGKKGLHSRMKEADSFMARYGG